MYPSGCYWRYGLTKCFDECNQGTSNAYGIKTNKQYKSKVGDFFDDKIVKPYWVLWKERRIKQIKTVIELKNGPNGLKFVPH